MIEARELSREFDGRVAVEEVSLAVPAGRVCALLGPNGAGKTTMVRMLLGLLPPTRGSAEVAGVALPARRDALAALRGRAGLLTETPGFYDRLSGAENLELFGRLYGMRSPERRARHRLAPPAGPLRGAGPALRHLVEGDEAAARPDPRGLPRAAGDLPR